MEQVSLFDDQATAQVNGDRPRCRMCARPAYWKPQVQQWSAYCWAGGCTNNERVCQADGCGKTFIRGVDGAGTKYCSTDCKRVGYGVAYKARTVLCEWCGKSRSDSRNLGTIWPYICEGCIDPIKHVAHRLKSHHVSHERARRLVDDPGCEICHRDIVTKVKVPSVNKTTALLVVDHDHSCCPSDAHSCGKCVRGLICRSCNMALGMLGDDPVRARAMAEYLTLRSSAASAAE